MMSMLSPEMICPIDGAELFLVYDKVTIDIPENYFIRIFGKCKECGGKYFSTSLEELNMNMREQQRHMAEIKLTHLPSGTVIIENSSFSSFLNRERAFERLKELVSEYRKEDVLIEAFRTA